MAAASVGGANPKKMVPSTDMIINAGGTSEVMSIDVFLMKGTALSSAGAAGAKWGWNRQRRAM